MTARPSTDRVLSVLAEVLGALTKAQANTDEVRDVLQAVADAYGIEVRFKDCCPKGHPYTPENTYYNKRGYRGCKQCHRAEARDWQRRRRAAKKASEADS